MTVRTALALGLALAVGGCLPSSQKRMDRSVSAADSVSAVVAAAAPVDSLSVAWEARAPAADPMAVPTSLVWAGDALAVVETQDGSVRRFTADGAYLDRTDLPAGSFPYAAGARGDTVVAFARGLDRLLFVVPGAGVAREVPTPAGGTAALATDGALAVRVGGGPDTLAAAVVRLGEDGREAGRWPLSGPAWRAVGRLRAWGDALVALSGYRPVVDVLPADAAPGAPLDTLALVGFDSPQLPRSAQFMRGDVDEPPLLTSSAAALGDRLLVLNLRTDRVRVDVYGRDGRLERVLLGPTVRQETDVATDLAVRRTAAGVEIAVLMARPPGLLSAPSSRVVLFRWAPPAA